MFISELHIDGFKGIKQSITFNKLNLIIGPNGAGKTRLCNLITGLTGNDTATELVANQKINEVTIVMKDGYTKTFKNALYMDEVNDFKLQLKERTSLILDEDQWEERYISCFNDPCKNIEHLKSFFKYVDFKVRMAYTIRDAQIYMDNGSALYYIMQLGLRMPPDGIPMILEFPERHLHIQVTRSFMMHFFENHKNSQLFLTTHSPELLCGVRNYEEFIVEMGQ